MWTLRFFQLKCKSNIASNSFEGVRAFICAGKLSPYCCAAVSYFFGKQNII